MSHEMLAQPLPDEMARQRFVLALKRHVTSTLRPGNALAYRKLGEPAFVAAHGREPGDLAEAEEALDHAAHYRMTKAVNRTSQEMMWQAVGETIYREQDRVTDAAARLVSNPERKGSLTLDPALDHDPVLRDTFVHLQPEGYIPPDPDNTSTIAGAFYESGGRLYSMGRGMGAGDSKAAALLGWLAEERPGWSPKRILDMGCSAGGASTSYPVAFPDAEVHAIDLGSSMLRYAHARAESLGVAVHFHQMDATRTSFPDGYFDLVLSHNMLHEISSETRRAVARESLRLLAPDGLCIHQDIALFIGRSDYWVDAERSYDVHWNNEPYWIEYGTSDLAKELVEAGFPHNRVRETSLSRTQGPGLWHAWVAER